MQISQIFTSCVSYIYPVSCKDKSDSLIEAMQNLDVYQIIDLLEQGINPKTSAAASEAFKEKLANLLIDRFFNKTCCYIFLNGLKNDQLTKEQQIFKEEALQEPNKYSEQECKAMCLQIMQDNLLKQFLPLNVANVALLTKDRLLTEKLVELKVLDARLSMSMHTVMDMKLFKPRLNLKLFEMLIKNNYSINEILNGEMQGGFDQALELYSDFLPPYTLVYKLFLNH